MAENIVAISVEGGDLQRAQAPAQPAFHHQALGRRQADASLRTDQGGNLGEVGLAQMVFAIGFKNWGTRY